MKARPTIVEINKDQEKLWEETRITLMWYCPAFTHIFMTMLNNEQDSKGARKHIAYFTKDVPIAATDGECVMINPDTFFKYTLQERVFIVGHEILHAIFNHCVMLHGWKKTGKVVYSDGVKLPYVDKIMQISLDLVINDILVDAKVGKFNKDWLHDTKLATKADNSVDVYRKLYEKAKRHGGFPGKGNDPGKGNNGNDPGGGNNPGDKGHSQLPDDIADNLTSGGKQSFDQHLPPGISNGKDPQQAGKDREANETKWQAEIASAAETQRQQGKMPAGLDLFFKQILTPVVDWRDMIRAAIARKAGSGGYDWERPDDELIIRDIFVPSRSGYGAGMVVVGVDTSGSIVADPRTLDMFMAEVSGILEDMKPRELHLLWCDARMHRADEDVRAEDLNHIRSGPIPGGGGTSFVPVFDWIADSEKKPDALIYLTDGEGTFPHKAPEYEVIWGYVPCSSYPVRFPFGEVVTIPKQV